MGDLAFTEARELTNRIKATVETAWELVTEAYTSRAWAVLGYPSWDVYCTTEFAGARIRLPREDRQEIVGSLRQAGLSLRAIASAAGEGKSTVARTLSGVPSGTPDPEPDAEQNPAPPAPPVLGRDGKRYSRSAPLDPARRPREASADDEAARGLDEMAYRESSEIRAGAQLAAIRRVLKPVLAAVAEAPDAEGLADITDTERRYLIDDLDAIADWASSLRAGLVRSTIKAVATS